MKPTGFAGLFVPDPITVQIDGIRGVRHALVTLERPITIIVGPNGSGKSTVLNQIRQQTFGRHIYIGPHRATRRQSARLRFMGSNFPAMGDLMSSQSLGGYEGVTITSNTRDAWELDEAANFFKYNISRIEFQRNSAIAKKWDSEGVLEYGAFPDVWEPLRDLTKNLMPHLEFSRVETENYDNMRCLFKVHSDGSEVDFDDLSSGEKSIVQTLYPVIERSIFEKLKEFVPSVVVPTRKDIIIIDEPELHLHPSLQEKLLNYLRKLAIAEDLFVLIATHSPTIIDSSDQSDILLLKSKEDVLENENQAIRLDGHAASLRVVQEAIGSVFPVTTSKPILIVEGADRVKVKNYSDKQLYTFIDPRFLQINILPGGGKEDCIRILSGGRSALALNPFAIKLFALVDRDLEIEDISTEGAFQLPVCMVENLLLKPEILREAVQPLLHQSPLNDISFAQSALGGAVGVVREAEVARRFRKKIRLETFGPSKDINSAKNAEAYRNSFKERIESQDYDALFAEAENEVLQIDSKKLELELYSGKAIVSAFFDANVSSLGISKSTFVYNAARAAREFGAYKQFFDDLFAKIL